MRLVLQTLIYQKERTDANLLGCYAIHARVEPIGREPYEFTRAET